MAYKDILPLLDAVAPPIKPQPFDPDSIDLKNKKKQKRRVKDEETTSTSSTSLPPNRALHILYDPYYCNGRTKQLLSSLGFQNVQHAKRDFYRDIASNNVPDHDTLITNPPYSGTHKEQCVKFAIRNLKDGKNPLGRAFFLLMPNYVAIRDHFRSSIEVAERDASMEIMYVFPSISYEYDHPEGTGKDQSPFQSIWFCGLPSHCVQRAKQAFRDAYGHDSVGFGRGVSTSRGPDCTNTSTPRLVSNLSELKELGAVPTAKRRNPKQRRKEKERMQQENLQELHQPIHSKTKKSSSRAIEKQSKNATVTEISENSTKRKSIYRDNFGKRKRRRF